jgi:cytoskeletal protein CcmA (bactofilin family)
VDGITRTPRLARQPDQGGGPRGAGDTRAGDTREGDSAQRGRAGTGPAAGVSGVSGASGAKPVTPPRTARPLVPGIPSRVVDPSGVVKHQVRAPDSAGARAPDPAESHGQLVVGPGIAFKGQIGACERLVVHGEVAAQLSARSLEVGAEGRFDGTVEVEEAEIAGRFHGTLTVRGVLTLRDGGRVDGTVRYHQLAVERGGQLAGDVDTLAAALPRDTAATDTAAIDTAAIDTAAEAADAGSQAASPEATPRTEPPEATLRTELPDATSRTDPPQPTSGPPSDAAAGPTPSPTTPSATAPATETPAAETPAAETPAAEARAAEARTGEARAVETGVAGGRPADADTGPEVSDIPLSPRRNGDDGSNRRPFRHNARARRLREYAERDL